MTFLRFPVREEPPWRSTEHNMLYVKRTVAQVIAVSNRPTESTPFFLTCVNLWRKDCGEFGSGTIGCPEILMCHAEVIWVQERLLEPLDKSEGRRLIAASHIGGGPRSAGGSAAFSARRDDPHRTGR